MATEFNNEQVEQTSREMVLEMACHHTEFLIDECVRKPLLSNELSTHVNLIMDICAQFCKDRYKNYILAYKGFAVISEKLGNNSNYSMMYRWQIEQAREKQGKILNLMVDQQTQNPRSVRAY